MLKKLLFLSFIEGAAVMAAELCGAKLLAPIFGSSLYVWASVMGITLAALAIGYFLGGLISEKSLDHKKRLFQILVGASFLLLLMPVISYYLVPRISYISFLPAVVISTIALLFFPIFLLGTSSPLFIALQITSNDSAGKVSGTVYAVSTLGGILATFLCGFYLIPTIGLNFTVLIFGGMLFLSSVLVFKLFKTPQFLMFSVFLYLNLQFSFKKANQLLISDSMMGHLEVENILNSKNDSIRILKINKIIQTEMNIKTKKSVSGYVNLLDSLIPYSSAPKKALVLGLGGGLTADLLVKKNFIVTGIEFDGRIIEAAKKYFNLDKNILTKCEDARYYLNHCDEKFDLILFDVFKAEEQPVHILTIESLLQLKRNLTNSAIIYINWHGYTDNGIGEGTSLLINTLKKSGYNIALTSLSNNQNYRNIIFVCALTKLKALPYLLNDKITNVTCANTDDKPLMEFLNVQANKTWRTNYLRYYQNN